MKMETKAFYFVTYRISLTVNESQPLCSTEYIFCNIYRVAPLIITMSILSECEKYLLLRISFFKAYRSTIVS